MVKDQQLIGRNRQFCVGLPFIVGEFNFVRTVQKLHDSADLASQEAVRGHVGQKSDDNPAGEVWCALLSPLFHETTRQSGSTLAASDDPRAPDSAPFALIFHSTHPARLEVLQ